MLIKGIMTTMSGSLGGVTGAHNKGGMYLRARAPVTNPNSLPQQRAREDFSTAVAEWGELTQVERQQWDDSASMQPWTNRVGDSITLSGQQWFIATNSALASTRALPPNNENDSDGLDNITAAPVSSTRPAPYEIGGGTFIFDNTSPDASGVAAAGGLNETDRYVIAVGNPIGPGVLFYRAPYRIGNVILGAQDDEVMAGAIYTAIVNVTGYTSGNIPNGSRWPIRVRAVRPDGQFSTFAERITGPTITSTP